MNVPRWSRPVVRVIAALIILMNALIIASYAFNNPIRVFPVSHRMDFDTAVCFFLVGLCFLIIARAES